MIRTSEKLAIRAEILEHKVAQLRRALEELEAQKEREQERQNRAAEKERKAQEAREKQKIRPEKLQRKERDKEARNCRDAVSGPNEQLEIEQARFTCSP
ncbi:hypothetical protein V8E54_005554 [Elaphomyces granulatus]